MNGNKIIYGVVGLFVLLIGLYIVKPELFGMKGIGIEQAAPQAQRYSIHDEATFTAGTQPFSLTPLNNPELAYTLLVPKAWEADTLPENIVKDLDYKIYHDTARFRSELIGVVRATLTVQALKREYEMSAKNWLQNYIISNGYAPQGQIKAPDDRSASTAFVWTTPEGSANHTYLGVRANGNALIVARFDMPIHLKDYLGFLQEKTVDSLRLDNPKNAPVETQKLFTLVDALKFSYPLSWAISGSDLRDMNRLSTQLQNKNSFDQIEGLIGIAAIRRTRSTTLATEIANFKNFFNTGFKFNIVSMTQEPAFSADARFLFHRLEVYDVENQDPKKAPQELRLTVLGDDDWYIFCYLVTPREHDNFYAWARNTSSFDVLLKSIR